MSGIVPAQGIGGNLPALRRREEASHAQRSGQAPLPDFESASTAALGRPHLTSTRPVASFLAQYVDQLGNLGRPQYRKEERRQQATAAYIEADMLPELLAETLRPHRERKL